MLFISVLHFLQCFDSIVPYILFRNNNNNYYYYIRLTAFFPGQPG